MKKGYNLYAVWVIARFKNEVTQLHTYPDLLRNSNNGLPVISSIISVQGNKHTIKRSSDLGIPEFRILHVDFGSLTLNDVTIENGITFVGGGIYVSVGSLNINRSTLTHNTAEIAGGGLSANLSAFTVNITDSTISNNSIRSSEIYGGGGIFFRGVSMTIKNSTISDNTSLNGNGAGGITNGGELTIINSTITNNKAGGFGGINNTNFRTAAASLTLKNTTVSHNEGGFVGGLFNDAGSMTNIDHTIIAKNIGQELPGIGIFNDCFSINQGQIISNGYNLSSDPSTNNPSGNGDCSFTKPTDISNQDPKLGPLLNNGGATFTRALLATSPAINVGGNCSPITTDQRGAPRPGNDANSNCDIGAYESGVAAISVSPDSFNFGNINLGTSSAAQFFTITNNGNGDFNLTQTTSTNPEFSATAPTLPLRLPYGATNSDTSVVFIPATLGPRSATLSFVDASPGLSSSFDVSLAGTGVQTQVLPSAQIAAILQLEKSCQASGNLIGKAPTTKAQPNRINAWASMIKSSSDLINNHNYYDACQQLQDVLDRADGKEPPKFQPDFVQNAPGSNTMCVENLVGGIQQLRTDLGCAP